MVHKELEEKGYVRTILGRERRLPDFNSSNGQLREFARRQAVNTPIQGSCADLIKIAMVNIYNEINKLGLKSRLVMQIHDELVFDVLPDEKDTVVKLVGDLMRNSIKLDVPIEVHMKVGRSLAELKEV